MRMKLLAGMMLAGALLIGGSVAYAADNEADWATTLKVKLVLLEKLGADSLHVDVDTDAGAVTLEGTVNKRETRELAESLAKSVASVESVKNDIKLEASEANPSKTSVVAGEAEAMLKDALLSTRIRLALIERMGGDGFKIGTDVANGVVSLSFDADFLAARRLEATKVVKGVEGVTKVVSVSKP